MNLIETPNFNSNETEQSEILSDRIFEKAKFDRLKTIILKSITKDIEVLIRNELLWKKYTLVDKLIDEKHKKEINMLR